MEWIVDATALDWTHERLDEFVSIRVASLVPRGFEAYARILRPPGDGEEPGSWRDVAAWSGAALGPSSSFEHIAVRHAADGTTERWPGGVPIGPPGPDEAAALIEVLRPFVDDDERCRFGVWEGYGWVWGGVLVMSTDPALHGGRPAPDELPVPAHVRDGPRASRPARSYVLYTGGIDDALALGRIEHRWTHDETPDLWWPSRRTWFVGADTDLSCTYVGGPAPLIDRLLAEPRLETQAVSPEDLLA